MVEDLIDSKFETLARFMGRGSGEVFDMAYENLSGLLYINANGHAGSILIEKRLSCAMFFLLKLTMLL